MTHSMSQVVVAKTHPSKYLLHKYWSRKPHNVIQTFLEALVPSGGTVIDPFCGSGVVISEAINLGFNTYGFDINPSAVLISKVTTSKILLNRFSDVVGNILNDVKNEFSCLYQFENQTIRYVVHEIVVRCPSCSKISERTIALEKKCAFCGKKLRLNLEFMETTRVVGVMFEGKKGYSEDEILCKLQEKWSNQHGNIDAEEFDFAFAENRRILAYKGIKTSDFFTKRNFLILTSIAKRFHSITDHEIKHAALALLTASAAQCSRLIPFRNNMSTGGPAWSVPGFWVPAIHVETNPIIHLFARFEKFKRGIKELEKERRNGNVCIEQTLSWVGLANLKIKGVSADLIFLDPPYGDSVPYLEFSALWNSFLRLQPNYDSDISVSNRLPASLSWKRYFDGIRRTIEQCANVLNADGKLLITFNNHDYQAWDALLSSLQIHNFRCSYVCYQIPAVISSKAQFSVEGSYIGDLYAVYERSSINFAPLKSLDPVIKALGVCASSRNGIIAKNLALRTISIAWMQYNISAELLGEREWIIKNYFKEDGGKLIWIGDVDTRIALLGDIIREEAIKFLDAGPVEWVELYKQISEKVIELGLPDPIEVREYLKDIVSFSKGKCWLKVQTGQLSMF